MLPPPIPNIPARKPVQAPSRKYIKISIIMQVGCIWAEIQIRQLL